ncbi:MAG: hypothetical protein ACK5CA_14330 [Cyanobacteriota bacterium]|jgi:hypothetical protein
MSLFPRSAVLYLFSLLFFGLALVGCGASKTAQCQKLILVTQSLAQESEKYRQSTDPQEVLGVAERFEEASQKLQGFKLADPQLSQFQSQLAIIYQGNGETTRTLIAALDSKDILTVRLAQDKVKKIGQQEREVITEMNRYCQTEP